MQAATASCEVDVKRCAIYIRVSTAEQRIEGWSLEAQRAALTALAKDKGWKVVGVYADEGKSARKRLKDRKAIHQLVEDVQAGLVDVILFKELDRWFRSISDFYKIQDVLDRCGVEWFSQQQPSLEMRTKEGRLQVNVLLSVGQNETDATSDRIKYTNKYLIQQKRWTGGATTLPRGYTLDADQHVIIDPEREPYVRDLIAAFLRTGSIRSALVETNDAHGVRYHYNNAADLLRNPLLYGAYKEVDDFVEVPYMTLEEWDRMQGLMKRNARGASHFYIFSSMLKCPDCGRSLVGNAYTKHGKLYHYYRCSLARTSALCPNNTCTSEGKVEKALLAYVRDAVADQIARVQEVQQARKKRKPRKSNRAQIEKQLKKLKRLYVEDEYTWEEYQKEKAAIQAKLIDDDEPEEKLPEVANLQKIQALFDSGIDELYQSFTPEERREFWRGVLISAKIKSGQVLGADFVE